MSPHRCTVGTVPNSVSLFPLFSTQSFPSQAGVSWFPWLLFSGHPGCWPPEKEWPSGLLLCSLLPCGEDKVRGQRDHVLLVPSPPSVLKGPMSGVPSDPSWVLASWSLCKLAWLHLTPSLGGSPVNEPAALHPSREGGRTPR